MKKLIKYFIKKKNPIFKLFYALILLFGALFTCCLLGSWTDTNNNGFKSTNLVDWDNVSWTDGYYIGADGSIGSNSDFHYSEYIEIEQTRYTFSANNLEGITRIHFYDTNYQWQTNEYIDVSGKGFIHFQNNIYKYIRVSICNRASEYMLNFGEYGLPYENYYNTDNSYTYIQSYNQIQRMFYYGEQSDVVSNNVSISNNGSYAFVPSNINYGQASIGFTHENVYLTNNHTYLFYYTCDNGSAIIEYFDENQNRVVIHNQETFVWKTGANITGIWFENNTSNFASFQLIIIDTNLTNVVSYDTYNDYVSNHSYTNQEYNSLQSQYNSLLNDYNSLVDSGSIDKLNYHIWIAIQNGSQTQYDFTKVLEISSASYIDDLGYLDISTIYNTYIGSANSIGNVILVELDNPVNALNFDLMFNVNYMGNNINFLPHFINFNPVYTPLYELNSYEGNALTLTNFIKYQDSSVLNIISYVYDAFAIVYTNIGDDLSNIKLNGQGDYNLGYLNGLEQNNYDFQQLQQSYDNLNNDYNSLQQSYDTLHARYDEIADTDLGFSMTKLVWSIASTPFESFKSIWSVDFLDFNIASFVTGILSIFVIVWLLKKIF